MRDDELAAAYQEAIRMPRTSARGECPTPDALAELAARPSHDEASLARLEHVMSCAQCLGDYELLRAVALASRPVARRREWGARRLMLPVGALLAASLLMMVVSRQSEPPVDPVRRAAAAEAPLTLVGVREAVPRGEPLSLTWRAVTQATAYDVELLSPGGELLASARTADTSAQFAADVVPADVSAVEWLVIARRADGNVLRSPLTRVGIQ